MNKQADMFFPTFEIFLHLLFQVKIAFQPYYVYDYNRLASQKSEVLALEKGKP